MSDIARRFCLFVLVAGLASSHVGTANAALVSYTYDLTGRLTTALYDTGLCLTYSYDPVGNRVSVANATSSPATWGSGVWGCFSWIP